MSERPTPEQIERWRYLLAVRAGEAAALANDARAAEDLHTHAVAVSLLAEVDALRHDVAAASLVRSMGEECKACAMADREREHLMHDTAKAVASAEVREERTIAERDTAIARAAAAEQRAKELEGALTKISAIRDSMVGMQGFNFSEHGYPLVAALDEAGFTGAGYKIARQNLGTLIEQRDAAEQRAGTVELALAELRRRAWLHLEYAGGYTDHVSRDGLRTALRDEPADLAEALRRELRAEGMEMGADLLSARSETEGRHEVINAPVSRGVYSIDLAEEAALLRQRAAELRGPK